MQDLARDRLAVSFAKSASRMREREADKFSDVTDRLAMVVSKRDWSAPRLARCPLMNDIAESTVFSASVALVNVVTSRSATLLSVEPVFAERMFDVVTLAANDLLESSVT